MPHGYQVTFEYITVLYAATYVHITKHRYRTTGYLHVITDCTFCNHGSFVIQCMLLMRSDFSYSLSMLQFAHAVKLAVKHVRNIRQENVKS